MEQETRRHAVVAAIAVWAAMLSINLVGWTEDLPLTKNQPITEFQNRAQDAKPYDFDAPPEGFFRSIATAEDFEEEIGPLRSHVIVPVKPTDRFTINTPAVFIVFALHQHYQGFKIFGQGFPESVPGLAPDQVVTEDVMQVALEDESGYLKLSPPSGGWCPGRYKVEIHAGEQVNEMSLMGVMRFTITAEMK
ncbi:MAG: hypothetical protein FJ244_01125 [Nitrospira sp.]|nr:hypothetical protein [Nitrospira sp.]